jgi:hypothetical protein
MARVLCFAALVVVAAAHGVLEHFPINPVLGVSGFPDCKRARPELMLSMEDASFDLICNPRKGASESLKIACVGDSITAGVHSTGGNAT